MDSASDLALSYLNFIPEPFQGLIIGWHKNTGRHLFLLPPHSIAVLWLGHRPALGKHRLLRIACSLSCTKSAEQIFTKLF